MLCESIPRVPGGDGGGRMCTTYLPASISSGIDPSLAFVLITRVRVSISLPFFSLSLTVFRYEKVRKLGGRNGCSFFFRFFFPKIIFLKKFNGVFLLLLFSFKNDLRRTANFCIDFFLIFCDHFARIFLCYFFDTARNRHSRIVLQVSCKSL